MMRAWISLGLVGMWAAPALGGEVLDTEVVQFAPVSPVLGGQTTQIRLLALDASGAPRTGLQVTPRGNGGTTANWAELGSGWYGFDFTADRDISLASVRLRGDLTSSVGVPVIPDKPGRLVITAEPPTLMAASSTSTMVTARAPGVFGDRPFDLRVSSGSASEPVRMEDGVWSTRIAAPTLNVPHLGVVTASIQGGVAVGGGFVGYTGAVPFPVQGAPNGRATLGVAGRTFGPVVLDGTGAGRIPIEVPAGVTTAELTVESSGKTVKRALDLALPPTRRLGLVPPPGPVPVGQPATFHVVVLQPDGSPDDAATLESRGTGGTTTPPRSLGGGLYELDYTASAGAEGSVAVRVAGSTVDVDTLPVQHLAPVPATGLPAPSTGDVAAVLLLPDRLIARDAGVSKLSIVALDRFGYPVPGVSITLASTIGTVPGFAVTSAKGVAEVDWRGGMQQGVAQITASAKNGVDGTVQLLATGRSIDVKYPEPTGWIADWSKRIVAPVVVEVPDPVTPEPVEPVLPPDPLAGEATDSPRARISVAGVFGSYGYEQIPTLTPGPLLPGVISMGGLQGGEKSSTQGVEVDARGWVVPWAGGHLAGRATQYTLEAALFQEQVSDWLSHIRAHGNLRVPVELGEAGSTHRPMIWGGVHGGYLADDFIVFKGCIEGGCRVDYESVVVHALEVGFDLGFEVGPVFGIASFDQGLAQATAPHRLSYDVQLGLELNRNVFLTASLGGVRRQIRIEGATSGDTFGGIVDDQLLGRLGVGAQF